MDGFFEFWGLKTGRNHIFGVSSKSLVSRREKGPKSRISSPIFNRENLKVYFLAIVTSFGLSYLGTPNTLGPLIPRDPSYLGTPHTWGPLIPRDPSYLGTPHTRGPLITGDPSILLPLCRFLPYFSPIPYFPLFSKTCFLTVLDNSWDFYMPKGHKNVIGFL